MGVIQDLRDEKALILFHDYRNNQTIDESKNEPDMTNLDGTETDTVWDGYGLTFPENTSEIEVAHDELLEIDEGCLIVFTNELFSSQTSTEYLMMLTSGGPDGWIWYLTATGFGILNFGAPLSLTTSALNKKTLALNFSNGSTPTGWADGVSLGNYSGSATVTKATSGSLYIGNSSAGSLQLNSTLQAALIVNRQLTSDEHADLHDELVARFEKQREDDAADRLLSQYQAATNLKKLINIGMNRLDNVDYMLRYTRDYSGRETATGEQLDTVGDILGIERPHMEQSYGTIFSFKPDVPLGTVWETETSAADNLWLATAYSPDLGLYAAVSSSGTGDRVQTSPDGITWTSRTSAADNNWRGLAWGNGVFVAVADSGASRVMTSPDGITWTVRACTANAWSSVVWSEDVGLFVAVGYSGVGNRVQTSPDGITWTTRTSAADNTWLSVTYGNGLFVAVSSDGAGNNVQTSPDGITWTLRACQNNTWRGVAFGGDLFAAVANAGSGTRVQTSPDGITWTTQTNDEDSNWRAICYAADRFVAVADNSGVNDVVMTSYNGVDWPVHNAEDGNSWRAICYGDNQCVAVGIAGTGNRVMRSDKAMGIDDKYKGWV